MAATAADQLLADVAATNRFLASMAKMPNYGSVLEVQANALCQRVRGLDNIMAETASKLADSWSAGPWTAEQSQRFSTVLTEAVAS